MTVLVTGGTGLIGGALVTRLRAQGQRALIASRRGGAAEGIIVWEPPQPLAALALRGVRAIVNLAGASIASGRWSDRRKEELWNSRIDATRAIVSALKQHRQDVRVLVNASAVGYYGPRALPVDESGEPGSDFLARLCQAWEEEALAARAAAGVRVVTLRIGIVLSREGGALKAMLPAFRLGLGGPLGSGRQAFPWIHIDDVVGLILHALERDDLQGAVNAVAPEPLSQRQFARALGTALHRPACLRAPAIILRLALGEMANLLLTGQPVIPKVSTESGYVFRYPTLAPALLDLVSRAK